jgi:hypothetical protein
MKFDEAIERLGREKAKKHAQETAKACGVDWNNGIGAIFEICLKDRNRRPNMGWKKDDQNTAVERWVNKYKKGYESRPSISIGKPIHTVPDDIIDEIISIRLNNPPKEQIEAIKFAHRLSMAAENILGLFLEEYLAARLKDQGWDCAWGMTLKSVDMCHSSGILLQVKNRSNTENSSSSTVRYGTDIKKWFRVDALSGEYAWDELQHLTGAKTLTEKDFRKFVIDAIKRNPAALALEDISPWTKKS